MNSEKTILIVEDDEGIRAVLQASLSSQGYNVITAVNGSEGLEKALDLNPDLIVLDVMLPFMDGYEVCKRARMNGLTAPIMMLTVRDEEGDKVLGLELGADDYVTKPFSLKEVLARIKALLRRVEDYQSDIDSYRFGEVYVDFKKHEVRKKGKDLSLSYLQLQILKLLITRKEQVISRDEFLDQIWGIDNLSVSPRTIDSHIAHIRQKVEDNPAFPQYILSVRSVGYKFVD